MNKKVEFSQQEVIAGLRARNPKITKHFVQRLRDRVYGKFRKKYPEHQHSWIDDSLSEAMIILLHKMDNQLPSQLSLDNYAFGIVKYSFFALVRKSRKEPTLSKGQLPERSQIDRRFHTSLQSLFDWEGQDSHLHWYRQLSERDQRLLNLRAQGFSNKEIASEMKMANGTVRNLLSKIMNKARKMIS